MAAVAEAQHDKEGLMWPWALAPYRVLVLPTSDDPEVTVACVPRIVAHGLVAAADGTS